MLIDHNEDADAWTPAILNRPKVANYVVHESFTVDTQDHEDHTFCGVMFDVECSTEAPLEFLQIDAVSVRGYLGPLTVWTTPATFRGKEARMQEWDCIYEQEHSASMRDYVQLELSTPVRLKPGERCGLYVHSTLLGDDAIVYDNQRNDVTYKDKHLTVLPGMAHLSNRPFGKSGLWGRPWRERREFVGQVSYGVGYKLWNPEVHTLFPKDFQEVVKLLLLAGRRSTCCMHALQDEVLFYILNLCRYDWFRNLEDMSAQEAEASRRLGRQPPPFSMRDYYGILHNERMAPLAVRGSWLDDDYEQLLAESLDGSEDSA
mmetsp:Transcript_26441/g.48414  ORF Transcript_26441/g.48414 Transcript_26441/m.48414 type:complete len:317 (+) Transcript_26441:74-1024(+)